MFLVQLYYSIVAVNSGGNILLQITPETVSGPSNYRVKREVAMNISQYNEENTPIKYYRPDEIDEYIVIVNLPEDWQEVHNYIINENEIDGIPNRKIDCTNDRVFSLRSSIYMMSHEEAEILKLTQRLKCRIKSRKISTT